MKKTIIIFLKQYSFAKQYFDYILQNLSNEYTVIVFHTSQLENAPNKNVEYLEYDISYWSNKQIKNKLIELNPSSILITNIRSLLDIYLMALCNSLQIKLLYLEHGLTLSKINVFKKSNITHSIKKYFYYSYKVVTLLLFEKYRFQNLRKIFNAFLKSNYSQITIHSALFYALSGKEILNKFFDLSKTKIAHSGYPIARSNNKLIILKQTPSKKQIVFIHQPLIADNFLNLKIKEEIQLLNDLSNIAKKYNYDFILKLHPRSDYPIYKSLFNNAIIYNEISTEQLIADSEIVIGYFSTALITALILNKKVLIFNELRINTKEINTFISSNNSFNTCLEFEILLQKIISETIHINQIDYIKLAGINNTQENRINVLKQLLH